jgi:hypothetical protein
MKIAKCKIIKSQGAGKRKKGAGSWDQVTGNKEQR